MDYGKKMNAIDFTSRTEYNGQWSKENEWDELWSEGSNMECDDRRWQCAKRRVDVEWLHHDVMQNNNRTTLFLSDNI